MYALWTSFEMGPGTKERAERLGEQFAPVLAARPGFRQIFLLHDDESGACAGFSLWETREDAEALIREPVSGVFRWKGDAVERILELSRLRPYLIQKYCVHAVNRMLEQERSTVRLEDVEAARDVVELETATAESDDPPPAGDAGVAD